jgi:hypothetical protein
VIGVVKESNFSLHSPVPKGELTRSVAQSGMRNPLLSLFFKQCYTKILDTVTLVIAIVVVRRTCNALSWNSAYLTAVMVGTGCLDIEVGIDTTTI